MNDSVTPIFLLLWKNKRIIEAEFSFVCGGVVGWLASEYEKNQNLPIS